MINEFNIFVVISMTYGGTCMFAGVLGTNLKITPDTYLSRDGGNTFKMVDYSCKY
jgi:hypothetical protein